MEVFLQTRRDIYSIYGKYLNNIINFNECPNIKGDEYYEILPPIGYAAHTGDLEFLKILILCGAKLEWYVYYAACYNNRENIVDYFINTLCDIPNECLHIAVSENHTNIIFKLLKYGLNPNKKYKSLYMDWIGYGLGLECKTSIEIATSPEIINILCNYEKLAS